MYSSYKLSRRPFVLVQFTLSLAASSCNIQFIRDQSCWLSYSLVTISRYSRCTSNLRTRASLILTRKSIRLDLAERRLQLVTVEILLMGESTLGRGSFGRVADNASSVSSIILIVEQAFFSSLSLIHLFSISCSHRSSLNSSLLEKILLPYYNLSTFLPTFFVLRSFDSIRTCLQRCSQHGRSPQ